MSEIPFRMFPIYLESDPKWIALSLKRRAVFDFLLTVCVYTKSHIYNGYELTYGQYVTSYRDFANKFNETVTESEDKIDRNFMTRFFQRLREDGFLEYKTIILARQEFTLISVIHSDTYNLIKKRCETAFSSCETGSRQGKADEARQMFTENSCQNENTSKCSEDISKNGTTSDNIYHDISNNSFKSNGCETHSNSFKQSKRDSQQEQEEQDKKTMSRKDNVRDDAFFKKNVNDDVSATKKFKLNPDQTISFQWLKSQEIQGTLDKRLCFWAKKHSLDRLKDMYRHCIKLKPANLGAYMGKLLDDNALVENDLVRSNREFILGYAEGNNYKIEIKEKQMSVIIFGKEIPFNYNPDVFVDILKDYEENFKRYG